LPQINIGLVATQNKGLPVLFRTYEGNISDVSTVEQLIVDVKRVDLSIDAIILDRGMASRNNLIKLHGDNLKIIGGVPLTSNEAKELVLHDISEENELMRPSGLIYYEDPATSLFGIPGRAIICFNHSDLERERTARLKKIAIAEIKVAEILSSQTDNVVNLEGLEKKIRSAIRGVSDYFVINNDGKTVTVAPHAENRRNARLQDGKCLLFTTNFEKSAPEIIATYFGKDVIEKIFDCFKNWLDLQPIRHFEEGNIDVYIFLGYLS
jgi:transposase